MTIDAWHAIRALRSDPPGRANTNEGRRRLFAAALRQAEELAESSATVSAATRPLPLFYSLSQAGRAIAAVHINGRWELAGHGLKFHPSAGGSNVEEMLQCAVTPPAGRPARHCPSCNSVVAPPTNPTTGAFQRVAEAVGSSPLVGRAKLGELWAANPDLLEVPFPAKYGSWPTPLVAQLGASPTGGHPPTDAADLGYAPTSGWVTAHLPLSEMTQAELADMLAKYPSLRGAVGLTEAMVVPTSDEIVPLTNPGWGPRLMIGMSAPPRLSRSEWWMKRAGLFSVVELPHSERTALMPQWTGIALPEVGGDVAPSPLMLWWALLLVLSDLARYHPDVWTKAIDSDQSGLAVPLQRLMDIAQVRIPERVLAALTM